MYSVSFKLHVSPEDVTPNFYIKNEPYTLTYFICALRNYIYAFDPSSLNIRTEKQLLCLCLDYMNHSRAFASVISHPGIKIKIKQIYLKKINK